MSLPQFLILLIIVCFPLSLEAHPSQSLRQKDYGRWKLWDHSASLGADLVGQEILALYEGGERFNLSYRSFPDELDGSLAVVMENDLDLQSPLWGNFTGARSDLSWENISSARLIRGPEVIRYGQIALFGVVALTEENPSMLEDFYLIRSLFGTKSLMAPFVRAGGYITDRVSLSASYEHNQSHGAPYQSGLGNLDDFHQTNRYSFLASWEISPSLHIYSHFRALEGLWGDSAPPVLMGSRKNSLQISQGSTIEWQQQKKIRAKFSYGLRWNQEEITGNEAFFQGLYGKDGPLENRRFFASATVSTQDFHPLFFGSKTEFSLRGEREELQNIGLKDHRGRRTLSWGHLLQRRKVGRRLILDGILGGESTWGKSLRLSGGGSVEVVLVPQSHFIQGYFYQHYRRPSWTALKAQFFDGLSNLILAGKKNHRPEKGLAWGLEYRGDWHFLKTRINFYDHQILNRLYPRPNGLGGSIFEREPQSHTFGAEANLSWILSDEFALKGFFAFQRLAPGRRPTSLPPRYRANLQLTYRANSESFFRGWTGGVRFRFRDKMETWDFLTQQGRIIPYHLGLDLRLSYDYHGLGNRLEFFFEMEDLLKASHIEWPTAPSNQMANPLKKGRSFWFGVRVSL